MKVGICGMGKTDYMANKLENLYNRLEKAEQDAHHEKQLRLIREEKIDKLSAGNRDLTEILDNALTCIDSDTKPTKETLKKWIETFERCKGVE